MGTLWGGGFFTVCRIVVLIWMPTIVVFEGVDTWQPVINTMSSVLAFLLIALRIIDALAAGVADLMEQQAAARSAGHADRLRHDLQELRAAVGLEERLWVATAANF